MLAGSEILSEAIETWKMCAFRCALASWLQLTDEPSLDLLKRIESYGVPLVLSQRIRRSAATTTPGIWPRIWRSARFWEVARRYPKLKIHFCNWIGLDGAKLAAAGLKGRCLIDFARLHVYIEPRCAELIEHLGIESIAFGSHAPFDYVGPSLVKLANLESLPPPTSLNVFVGKTLAPSSV